MTWTAPMTAVSGAIFTAGQYNTYVRDNLLESGVAKISAGGGKYFVATGANSVSEREVASSSVTTSETTTSTTYANLTTAGPLVTVETGYQALVFLACQLSNSTADASTHMGYEVSGATTAAASNTRCIHIDGHTTGNGTRIGSVTSGATLTPGTNTFRAMYRVSAGTGTFMRRTLIVMPL